MNKNHTKTPAGSTPASANSNELVIISQQEVLNKNFTVYGTFENPLFLAKDVAEWIEHTNHKRMIENVDPDEKLKEQIVTSGQRREQWFLTEHGLYEVLFQSNMPIAKSFKKEVKKILKELRVKGYLPSPEASELVEIQRKELEALQLIRDLSNISIHTYSPDFLKRFKTLLTVTEAVAFDLLLRKYKGKV